MSYPLRLSDTTIVDRMRDRLTANVIAMKAGSRNFVLDREITTKTVEPNRRKVSKSKFRAAKYELNAARKGSTRKTVEGKEENLKRKGPPYRIRDNH